MTLWRKWRERAKGVFYYLRLILWLRPLTKWRYRKRKILTHPHKTLLTPTEQILTFGGKDTQKLEHLISIMFTTLNKQNWGQKLGIAAPQIGVNKRVMIVLGKAIVNPEFTPSKAPPETITEGCYSLGKRLFKVPRAKYGWAKWQDTTGTYHEEKISGLKAIVFQHELDHLNGKSCVENGVEIERPKPEKPKNEEVWAHKPKVELPTKEKEN